MARSFFNLLLHHPSISFGQDLPCELVDRSNKLVDHLHECPKLLLALVDVLEHANLIDALEHANLVDALLGTLDVAELLLNDSLRVERISWRTSDAVIILGSTKNTSFCIYLFGAGISA